MEKANQFFENYIGEKAFDFVQLPQSGSSRKNFVAQVSEKKYIITENEDVRENESFFYFSKIFGELNLNTPKIFKISPDRKIYIQEFLGEENLSQIIEKEGLNGRTKNLVQKSLDALFHLQQSTEDKIDFSKTFDYECYDELPILHDLYYFKNFLADILEIQYHKSTLLKEFKTLVSKIENLEPKGMMIRDFQSRNIMVDGNNEVHFIDYQSAMKGPLMYDVISFLFQAKANFPVKFKEEMLEYYVQKFNHAKVQNQLKEAVPYLKMMRFLQVLGAYGFRGLIQRKTHFISSLELGIKNIVEFSKTSKEIENYPELKTVIEQLYTDEVKMKIKHITNH